MADTTLAASRRAVIMGLAGTAAFAGTIGAAIASPAEGGGDHALLAAWEEYKRLQRLNYSTPSDGWDNKQEAEFYRQLDAVEIVIEGAEAKTPKGAAAQILLCIMNGESGPEIEQAIIKGGTMPPNYGDLDWSTKLAFRAAAALHTMDA